jgi:hypothetical protein
MLRGLVGPALFRLEDLYKWSLYDRDPTLQWSQGRAALLGDAAAPDVAESRPGRWPGTRSVPVTRSWLLHSST